MELVHGKAFKPEVITRKSYFTSALYKAVRVLQCKGVASQGDWVFLCFTKPDHSVTFRSSKDTLQDPMAGDVWCLQLCDTSCDGSCEFNLLGWLFPSLSGKCHGHLQFTLGFPAWKCDPHCTAHVSGGSVPGWECHGWDPECQTQTHILPVQ